MLDLFLKSRWTCSALSLKPLLTRSSQVKKDELLSSIVGHLERRRLSKSFSELKGITLEPFEEEITAGTHWVLTSLLAYPSLDLQRLSTRLVPLLHSPVSSSWVLKKTFVLLFVEFEHRWLLVDRPRFQVPTLVNSGRERVPLEDAPLDGDWHSKGGGNVCQLGYRWGSSLSECVAIVDWTHLASQVFKPVVPLEMVVPSSLIVTLWKFDTGLSSTLERSWFVDSG